MIEIQGAIEIGPGITIGAVRAIIETNFFVTQNGVDNLVTQTDNPLIEE